MVWTMGVVEGRQNDITCLVPASAFYRFEELGRCVISAMPMRRTVISAHRLEAPSSAVPAARRSEEHTSELQSLMRISYAVFCLTLKTTRTLLDTPDCLLHLSYFLPT